MSSQSKDQASLTGGHVQYVKGVAEVRSFGRTTSESAMQCDATQRCVGSDRQCDWFGSVAEVWSAGQARSS